MTYQELINNIKSLGFADDADIQEYTESGVLADSINRSIAVIGEAYPVIQRYEFDITGVETGFRYINMAEEDDGFLDFGETPVLFAESTPYKENGVWKSKDTPAYEKFNNFEIEGGDTIVIDLSQFNKSVPDPSDTDNYARQLAKKWSFRICYKAEAATFTGAELNDTLPLQRKVHHLVPLLASYYVWLDDDATKAAQYYNMYEASLSKLEANSSANKPRMRIIPGGI